MAVKTVVQMTKSGSNQIDSLLTLMKWGTNTVTFSMTTAVSDWSGYASDSYPYNNYRPLSPEQQTAARAALTQWASVCNLQFTEVEGAGGEGMIRFGTSGKPDTSLAYIPGTSHGGDIWFGNKNYAAPNHPNPGSYDYQAFVHEIGHALGLKHPHQPKIIETDGMVVANDVICNTATDCMDYSIMSYCSYEGAVSEVYTNRTGSFPQGPMMSDIAAVQYMYGANYRYNAGNTIYSFDPHQAKIYTTIWDGGGNDTYDFSKYGTDAVIDLRPGQWSLGDSSQLAALDNTGRKARGCVANALLYQEDTRSLIENAVGGSGNDIIVGNQADNIMIGGGGNDLLYGDGAGVDYLWGGTGNDVMQGSAGADMYWWGKGDGADRVAAYGGNGKDVLYMYNVMPSDGFSSDRVGDDLRLTLQSGDSMAFSNWYAAAPDQRAKSFLMANGIDYLWNNGEGGIINLSDRIFSENQVHTVVSNDRGNCILIGSLTDDCLQGHTGNDNIWGASGNDILSGGGGADTFWFGASDGQDRILSGDDNGNDTVILYNIQNAGSAQIMRSGENLQIGLSNGDCLTIQRWYLNDGNQLNRFQFADGSVRRIVNSSWA